MIYILVAMLSIMTSAKAMTYEQAREQALFLTDKMAYELNLSQEQFEAAYEINLDYLLSINTVGDVYAESWRQRNLDLQYILYDWQYTAYQAASYFFRPVFWNAGYWHFSIYSHYPHRTHYYFSYPVAYRSYRGAHSWRYNGGRSWYVSRRNHYRPEVHRQRYVGMRDGYHRSSPSATHRSPTHRSSTRETVGRNEPRINGNRHTDGNRNHNNGNRTYSRPSHTQNQGGSTSQVHGQNGRQSGSTFSGTTAGNRPNTAGTNGRRSGSTFSGSSRPSSSTAGRSFSGGSNRSFSTGSATRSGASATGRHGGGRR